MSSSEIGLPTGWANSQLGDVLIAVVGGGTPSRNVPSYFNGPIPWFTVKDIKTRRPNDAEEHISEVAILKSATNLIPADTLIVATRIALGRAMKPTIPCAINQDLKALFVGPGMNSDFLLYWVFANERAIREEGSGTTVSGIRLETLHALLIRLPPEKEQSRIVDKLEELLSDLDAGVAELQTAQRKLAQYRQSLLKAAVEGTLTAGWRAAPARDAETSRSSSPRRRGSSDVQPGPAKWLDSHLRGNPGNSEAGADLLQRILTERRARWEAKQLAKFAEQNKVPPSGWQVKYAKPVVPDVTTLPAVPEGWTWATIGQLAYVGTGVTPLRSNPAYFQSGTTPWVTSGALNSEAVTQASELVTDLALKECRLEVFPSGSLLVAMYGEGKTRGKCSELLIPATINQAIAALVLDGWAQGCNAYLKVFLLHSYEKMRQQASGGVQPNLNLQIIKSIALPFPPAFEQTEITRLLAMQLEQVERQSVAIDHSLKQAAAQRKNILKAAFAGQLVPQDPNDEPASVLLERIRAERAARAAPSSKRGRTTRKTA